MPKKKRGDQSYMKIKLVKGEVCYLSGSGHKRCVSIKHFCEMLKRASK